MQQKKIYLENENATLNIGKAIALQCKSPCVIYLKGELGAGKTTFVRGFLRGLGFQGKVKSPTYTWIETYSINGQQILHFDFFRAHDPHELEFIGMRDYYAQDAILLIEWPEKGLAQLPMPDLELALSIEDKARKLVIKGFTAKGQEILNHCHPAA